MHSNNISDDLQSRFQYLKLLKAICSALLSNAQKTSESFRLSQLHVMKSY